MPGCIQLFLKIFWSGSLICLTNGNFVTINTDSYIYIYPASIDLWSGLLHLKKHFVWAKETKKQTEEIYAIEYPCTTDIFIFYSIFVFFPHSVLGVRNCVYLRCCCKMWRHPQIPKASLWITLLGKGPVHSPNRCVCLCNTISKFVKIQKGFF